MWIEELAGRVGEIEKYRGRPIMAVCYSGQRSREACQVLAQLGFEKLYNAPGMMFWADKEYEVVPGRPTPDMPT